MELRKKSVMEGGRGDLHQGQGRDLHRIHRHLAVSHKNKVREYRRRRKEVTNIWDSFFHERESFVCGY